jgi:hypothetical protein
MKTVDLVRDVFNNHPDDVLSVSDVVMRVRSLADVPPKYVGSILSKMCRVDKGGNTFLSSVGRGQYRKAGFTKRHPLNGDLRNSDMSIRDTVAILARNIEESTAKITLANKIVAMETKVVEGLTKEHRLLTEALAMRDQRLNGV